MKQRLLGSLTPKHVTMNDDGCIMSDFISEGNSFLKVLTAVVFIDTLRWIIGFKFGEDMAS